MDEQQNEAVFRRFYEAVWNEGDLAVTDEILSDDFVNHAIGDIRGATVNSATKYFTSATSRSRPRSER